MGSYLEPPMKFRFCRIFTLRRCIWLQLSCLQGYLIISTMRSSTRLRRSVNLDLQVGQLTSCARQLLQTRWPRLHWWMGGPMYSRHTGHSIMERMLLFSPWPSPSTLARFAAGSSRSTDTRGGGVTASIGASSSAEK